MDLPQLILKKGEERRLRGGHLWVFSNEVDTTRTPLSGFAPGDPAVIVARNGKPLGTGYVNPNSLICARLVTRRLVHPFDAGLLAERVDTALALRERLFPERCYRLVFGESDGLPGLVVDRYGGVLVIQTNTAGTERARDAIVATLLERTGARVAVLRNDSPARALEGLATYVETAAGEPPDLLGIEENGARFEAPLLAGQKTGWFFDHRLNRRRLSDYAPGARVLDVFSYLGAWGIQAALAGAARVTCVDASETAVPHIRHNAALNGVAERVEARVGDAFKTLKALAHAGERYELVVLDPPAFIKRRKDIESGVEAYGRLNGLAMDLVPPGGTLITASCSSHLHPDVFIDALRAAAARHGRRVQILEQGHQSPDHPVHPSIPETAYLKCLTLRVLAGE